MVLAWGFDYAEYWLLGKQWRYRGQTDALEGYKSYNAIIVSIAILCSYIAGLWIDNLGSRKWRQSAIVYRICGMFRAPIEFAFQPWARRLARLRCGVRVHPLEKNTGS